MSKFPIIILVLILAFFGSNSFECKKNRSTKTEEIFIKNINQKNLNRFIELESFYQEINHDSALFYVNKILDLSNNPVSIKVHIFYLIEKAHQLRHKSLFLEAYNSLKISDSTFLAIDAHNSIMRKPIFHGLKSFNSFSEDDFKANYFFELGNLLSGTRNNKDAITNYYKAENICLKSKNKELLGNIYLQLSIAFGINGQNDASFKYVKKAEKINTRSPGVYVKLSELYSLQKDTTEELFYLKKACSLTLEDRNYGQGIFSFYGITNYYLEHKNRDSSLFYSIQSLSLLGKTGSKDLFKGYKNIYKSYILTGNQDSVTKYQGLALNSLERESLSYLNNSNSYQRQSFTEQLALKKKEEVNKENESKIKIFSLILFSFCFILISLLLLKRNLDKNKSNKLLKVEKEKVENTLLLLQQMQDRLIQSEKLSYLGEVTSGIAHEILNPLNFVNNFSEINEELLQELILELDLKNYVEVLRITQIILANEGKISTHGKRANIIVKSMLSHGNTKTQEKTNIQINQVLQDNYLLAFRGFTNRESLSKMILIKNLDPNLSLLKGENQELGRVFFNIFNNALYALVKKTELNIPDYSPELIIETKNDLRTIFIRIRDNGIGVSAINLKKLFLPFYTNKPTGEGTGLGLSISYDIITKLYQGEIEVESVENVSTEFLIQIPIS